MKNFVVVVLDSVNLEGEICKVKAWEYTGIRWNNKADADQEAKLARSCGRSVLINTIND